MYPYISIYGHDIPVYTLCASVGAIVAMAIECHLLLVSKQFKKYIDYILVSFIGILIGGKAFGILSTLLSDYNKTGLIILDDILLRSGFVFYVGLIGFLVTLMLICRIANKPFHEMSGTLGISIPLFHAFGRVGCYFGGCCYGKISSSWLAIPYTIVLKEDIHLRFPVQIYEAIFEFLMFITMYLTYKRHSNYRTKVLSIYLFTYSIFRFFIEFLRGDEIRGIYGLLSFSQYISIMVFIISLLYLIRKEKI